MFSAHGDAKKRIGGASRPLTGPMVPGRAEGVAPIVVRDGRRDGAKPSAAALSRHVTHRSRVDVDVCCRSGDRQQGVLGVWHRSPPSGSTAPLSQRRHIGRPVKPPEDGWPAARPPRRVGVGRRNTRAPGGARRAPCSRSAPSIGESPLSSTAGWSTGARGPVGRALGQRRCRAA